MAERRGPTDGKRYKRAAPSRGNTKKPEKRTINRRAGETLLNAEMQDKLVNLIRAGNYAEVAARACGINKQTFYNWLSRGGRGEEPFTALVDAIENATAQAEARDVALIGKAAETYWQAAAWRLERKNARRWGRKDHLEVAGDPEAPMQVNQVRVDLERLSASDIKTLIALRAKARADEPAE